MKIILLAGMLIAGITKAAAQHPSIFAIDEAEQHHTFYGGVTAGANFSQVDGDGFEGYHRAGIHAGPLVYARVLGPLLASLELLYAQKGSKARYLTESPYTGTTPAGYDLKLNYVEVPVLLHFIYRPRFSVGAGISYSRLISFKESAFVNFPVNIYSDVNYFHKDDWCALGQINYEFSKGWLILIRYGYSIRSIRDADRIPQGYGGGYFGGQYNNLFTVKLIYFFRSKEELR